VLLAESRQELTRADGKASTLLAALGIGVSAILAAILAGDWSPFKLKEPYQGLWWAGSVCAGLSFLCLALAVYPRVKHNSASKGVTYFGDVAALETVDELRAALKRSETNAAERSVSQLHVIARLAVRKYRFIRWGPSRARRDGRADGRRRPRRAAGLAGVSGGPTRPSRSPRDYSNRLSRKRGYARRGARKGAAYSGAVGRIVFRSGEFITSLSETVGYKSGLALDADRLREIADELGLGGYWPEDEDRWYRIRSEEYEELFAGIRGRLGAGPPRRIVSPIGEVYHRTKHDAEKAALFEVIAPIYTEFLKAAVREAPPGTKKIDPRPLLVDAEKHGEQGVRMAIELLELTNAYLFQSPWGGIRRIEWADVRELDELFRSENLDTAHGEYFDQRFVDFLAANFDDVDEINWRQFEGLSAEFFARDGFLVELGPGRADGGVDIRLWPDDSSRSLPPTVLVQCKRQQRRTANTVVKALWADVQHEGADSGLIVTTSSFSPSARKVRTARGYEVTEADRTTLQTWINAMRTPGAGVFLGE
jgi:Restriction endonuclease/Pycsar effector protein